MSSRVALCLVLALYCSLAVARPLEQEYDYEYESDYQDADLEEDEDGHLNSLKLGGIWKGSGDLNSFDLFDWQVDGLPSYCNASFLNYTYLVPCPAGLEASIVPQATQTQLTQSQQPSHPHHPSSPHQPSNPHQPPHGSHPPETPHPPHYPYPNQPIIVVPPRQDTYRLCTKLPGLGLACTPGISFRIDK